MSRRMTKKLAYQQYKERCYIHLSQVWDNNKNMTYFFIYHLLTKSGVITGKSQTEALMS